MNNKVYTLAIQALVDLLSVSDATVRLAAAQALLAQTGRL